MCLKFEMIFTNRKMVHMTVGQTNILFMMMIGKMLFARKLFTEVQIVLATWVEFCKI